MSLVPECCLRLQSAQNDCSRSPNPPLQKVDPRCVLNRGAIWAIIPIPCMPAVHEHFPFNASTAGASHPSLHVPTLDQKPFHRIIESLLRCMVLTLSVSLACRSCLPRQCQHGACRAVGALHLQAAGAPARGAGAAEALACLPPARLLHVPPPSPCSAPQKHV